MATNSWIGWWPWPRAHIDAGSICTMTSSRKHSDPYNFWHVIMLALIISDQAAPDRNTCRSMLDSTYIICTICNYNLCESLYSSKCLHELFVKNIVPSLFQEKTMLPKCNTQKRDATWSLHSESRSRQFLPCCCKVKQITPTIVFVTCTFDDASLRHEGFLANSWSWFIPFVFEQLHVGWLWFADLFQFNGGPHQRAKPWPRTSYCVYK